MSLMFLLQLSVNRQSAILVMTCLVSISFCAFSDNGLRRQDCKIWPVACFSYCALKISFCFSSRKWAFLLNWLYAEWHQMVLRSPILMTEACWIYVVLMLELWMLFETSFWIWFNFLGVCSSLWVHCWQQT